MSCCTPTVSPCAFHHFPGAANTLLALVTGQLAQDIKAIRNDIEQLYGILNEDSLKLQ